MDGMRMSGLKKIREKKGAKEVVIVIFFSCVNGFYFFVLDSVAFHF